MSKEESYQIRTENVKKALAQLSTEEIEEMMTFPLSIDEQKIEIEVFEEDEKGDKTGGSFLIHARIKKECYAIYTKVRYYGWTTQGGVYNVDTIKLTMNSGGGSDTFYKTGTNVNEVKKLDEIYTNISCHSAKLTVFARKGAWSGEAKVKV
jgi:hypothetical protein